MRTISLRLPEAVYVELSALSRVSGKSKSDLVREALDDRLSNGGRGPGLSFAELAQHLRGEGTGPTDLAVNKDRYLAEGFGE